MSTRRNIDMKRRTAVCRLDEIVANTGVCALVGDRQVAVFRLDDDSVFALANRDPYSKGTQRERGQVRFPPLPAPPPAASCG